MTGLNGLNLKAVSMAELTRLSRLAEDCGMRDDARLIHAELADRFALDVFTDAASDRAIAALERGDK